MSQLGGGYDVFLQDDVDAQMKARMNVVFTFIEVASVLKSQRFFQGAKRLFDQYAVKGTDGVARVGSNGFLRLALHGKLAPAYMSNMDVLRCVEICLDRGAMERAHHSGLLFDTFVECLARLAMIAFSELSPVSVAELIMLQLDQGTHCLTSSGAIHTTPLIVSSSPRFRAKAAQAQAQVDSALQSKDDNEIPVPRMPPPPPPVEDDHVSETGSSLLSDLPATLSSSTGFTSSSFQSYQTSAMASESCQSGPSKGGSQSIASGPSSVTTTQPAPIRKGPRNARPNSKMTNFLARMERDKADRERKIADLRKAAAPRQVHARTEATSAAEQAEIATRLHESRKLHFEKKRERHQAMLYFDSETGQPFFKPQLRSKTRGRTSSRASTATVGQDGVDGKGRSGSVDVDDAGAGAGTENCGASRHDAAALDRDEVASVDDEDEWKDRFEKLHVEATRQQSRKAARERATIAAHKRLAAAPKASARTKVVFARKLARELHDAFMKACIAAGDDPSNTLTRAQAKAFMESLIGLVPAARHRAQADQDLVDGIMNLITDGGTAKEVNEARFARFARAVAAHDPVASQPHGALSEPFVDLIHEFRLRLMSQRKFAQAMRKQAFIEAAAAVRPTFTPKICQRSRELDEQRRSRDAVSLSREQDLLERKEKAKRALEEKRKLNAATSEVDDEECTFRPKITPHNPRHAGPPMRSLRPCCRHRHGLHECESDVLCGDGDVESKSAGEAGPPALHTAKRQHEQNSRRNPLRNSAQPRGDPKSRYPEDYLGRKARPFTYSSVLLAEESGKAQPAGGKGKPRSQGREIAEHDASLNDEEEEKMEEDCEASLNDDVGGEDASSVGSDQSEDVDALLFYADVQVRKQVHRIPVYENDDLRKVAARFSALHNLSASVEHALYAHLTTLIEAFP